MIDIITTLKVLAPKFKTDQRLPIAQKFYELLSLAPTFHLESEDFGTFLKWCLSLMWKNVNDPDFAQIVKPCIIQNMTSFSLQNHEQNMLLFVQEDQELETQDIPGKVFRAVSIMKPAFAAQLTVQLTNSGLFYKIGPNSLKN